MGYWNSRGLRGSAFEETINLSNENYRQQALALIEKIPTPIVPVELNQQTRVIEKAYFDKKSTVDYIGVMNGFALAFDAKETALRSLPFSNIHPHQVEFMKDFVQNGGYSFFLVHFTRDDAYYLLPLETMVRYYEAPDGPKHIPREAFEERFRIDGPNPYLPYLKAVVEYIRTCLKD